MEFQMADKKKANKKKNVKKLKTRKLEDRIAPAMIGGGMVDPGMVEPVDDQIDTQQDETAGATAGTEISAGSEAGAPSDAGYLDDTAETGELEAEAQADDTSYDEESDEFKEDGDEFQDANTESASADYVEEAPTWQEPDWVTANADGSVAIALPEGVDVDNGIADFPVDTANEALPLPEGVDIQADGSVNVALPEGTQFIEESATMILPSESVPMDDIPEEFKAMENPDGSITCNLPEDGCSYDAETNTLNVDNYTANQCAPDYMEISDTGSVALDLPPDCEVGEDGSMELSQEETGFYDHPAPDYIDDCDWANANLDGSITCEIPEGVSVDNGLMFVDYDAVEELPLPEDVTLNADGTMDYALPESCEYNADASSLTFPEGEVHLDEVPEGFDAHINPDGTLTAVLPEGVDYNVDSNSLHLDNHWANECSPDSVAINYDGSVVVELPPATEYFDDGSFSIDAEHANFVDAECPDYTHDCDFTEATGDGSYNVQPPEGFNLDTAEGELEIPHDAIDQLPIPEEVTINPDGTMDIMVPEGSLYDAHTDSLTFAEGSVHIEEIPEGINAHVNPDGTVTAYLPDGIEFNEDTGTLDCDNHWANEITPDSIEINAEGGVIVDLPSDCEYNDDGSFTIPEHSADFLENPEPGYVADGPDWCGGNPDGSVTVQPPEEFKVDPEANTMSCGTEHINEEFEDYKPEDVTFNADGTMDVGLPDGTVFNAETGALTFPAGEVHLDEIPDDVNAHINPDGTLTVELPDGVDYNADANTLHMDNEWCNEVTPDCVEFSPEGQCEISLPEDCHHFEDGSFNIPEGSTDFIENPDPAFVTEGPEWCDANADGSVNVVIPTEFAEQIEINPEAGTMTLDTEVMQEQFENYVPEEMTFNADGTADVSLPEGTDYNADAHSLTFPEGEMHLNEIPDDVNAQLNPDGTITVNLQDGMEYNADTGSVQLDNYWCNEVTPDCVEFTPEGNCVVDLPPETQYFEGGEMNIPAEATDFIENPEPAYVTEGPAWVDGNPDGSVTMEIPAEMQDQIQVDPNAGTMTMDAEFCNEQFDDHMPDDFQFNADGTSDVSIPEGTEYNADANSLTFPQGTEHINELPEEIQPTLNADGTITVTLQDGMTFDGEANSVNLDNYWTNEFTPEAVEFSPDGQLTMDLPNDTMYFDDGGSCTIPEGSCDFMENPEPGYVHDGPDYVNMNPDGSITMEHPEYVEFNPDAGTMSMSCEDFSNDYAEYIPDDMTFNADGSVDVMAPEGTQFDPAAETLTFPAGEVHLNEIPEGIAAELNDDGTITVTLNEGMNYDDAAGSIHFEPELVSELSPEPMHIDDGHVTFNMPEGTEYFEGGCVIPEGSADFMDEGPQTDYQGNDPAAMAS